MKRRGYQVNGAVDRDRSILELAARFARVDDEFVVARDPRSETFPQSVALDLRESELADWHVQRNASTDLVDVLTARSAGA